MKISLESNQRFLIETRKDISRYFQYSVFDKVLIKKLNKYKTVETKVKVYTKPNKYSYSIAMGYIYYAINLFQKELKEENVREIVNYMRSEVKLENPYKLYDWLADDLRKLIKYRRGIFNVYTGAGKSECIAVLVKNLVNQGHIVLVVTPNKGTVSELRSRLKDYDVPVNTYINNDAQVNIINPIGLCASKEWDRIKAGGFKYFNKVTVTISDETEMSVHNSYRRVEKRLINCTHFWGFTATANKKSVDPIPKDKSLLKILNPQIHSIVRTYGYSAVFELPKNKDVTIHTLYTTFQGFNPKGLKYHEVVSELLSNYEFLYSIRWILRFSGNLYIPVNNLRVINRLIKSNLTDEVIAVIQGKGISLHKEKVKIKDISLSQLKELLLAKKIKLVLGSSASFRALDLVGLNSVLATFGRSTSSVIQYVGRASRTDKMHIWFVQSEKYLRIYSNTVNENQKLLARYYRLCKVSYDEQYL